MIRTIGLTKIFRAEDVETTALKEVNFHVDEGEFVAIMGPSGCGKSTFLSILGMLDTPTSGEYLFQGVNVAMFSEKQRSLIRKQKIGFIFQNFNLIDELNIYENVELPLIYMGVPLNQRKEKVTAVLEYLELNHRQKSFPVQLSGGQQQRVAVARALVSGPSLILADEPTGNLDSQHGEEVMKMMAKLNESGTTIVMVTHSQRDAEYSSRLINLFDGQIVTEKF
ncbi:MAG TPA: ABC transporter ATP-binding protein [Bacteroidales bacterium]|nr:ABC transporter ATP-binding protein [Bacteroidales bacterium]HPS73166.1 ABC transporter ATP-binding protein [Bacteroidales bacterium]